MPKIVDGFREKATFPESEGSNCDAKEHEYVARVYDMILQEL